MHNIKITNEKIKVFLLLRSRRCAASRLKKVFTRVVSIRISEGRPGGDLDRESSGLSEKGEKFKVLDSAVVNFRC
jgi:hypothetical protein